MAHTMWLTKIDEETGAETWECPCGRVVIIHSWRPWKRTVVTPGEENVNHSGSKGGLHIGEVKVSDAHQHPNG